MGQGAIMRLNLGCCDLPLKGWINVDKSESPHIKSDVTCDALKLDECFEKGEVEEIYAGHLLEHLTPTEADEAIEHWKSMLCEGGKLGVVVPDAKVIAQMYLDGEATIKELNDVYIYSYCQESLHKSLWDTESLRELFEKHGFIEIKEIDRLYDKRQPFGAKWQTGQEGIVCN